MQPLGSARCLALCSPGAFPAAGLCWECRPLAAHNTLQASTRLPPGPPAHFQKTPQKAGLRIAIPHPPKCAVPQASSSLSFQETRQYLVGTVPFFLPKPDYSMRDAPLEFPAVLLESQRCELG